MSDECGHIKNDGESCTFNAKYEDGKCGHHTECDTGNDRDSGRPSKLSYERQEQRAADIEQGRSMTSAARKSGVTPQTVINWMDKGKAAKENNEENEYSEFLERITRAKGEGEEYYFRTVVEMAKDEGDHRFLASLMKQRYPEAWAEKENGGPGVDTSQTVINIPDSVTEKWKRQ